MAQQQTVQGKKAEVAGIGAGKVDAARVPDRQQGTAYEIFNPPFHWSRQPGSHVLCFDLPGFKKDDLKVQVDNSGKLSVRGRRQVEEGRFCRFDQVFDVPKGSDVDLIAGKFDDGHLTITIPELLPKPDDENTNTPPPRHKEASNTEASRQEQQPREEESWLSRAGFAQAAESLLEKINENKRVIAVAAVAFSIGFLLSGKRRM